jgi:uncharacterized membrane protein
MTPPLPAHIEATVTAIAEVHAQHYRKAGIIRRVVTAATSRLAQPMTLLVLTVAVGGWIALNLVLPAAGLAAPDPPPFGYLSTAVSIAALYLTAMVLITQRHDDELANDRDRLTLELAILSERKSAKIIQLLEEGRISDPQRSSHRNLEAEALATPADPRAVLDAIKAVHGER